MKLGIALNFWQVSLLELFSKHAMIYMITYGQNLIIIKENITFCWNLKQMPFKEFE